MKDLRADMEDPVRKPFLVLAVVSLGCLLLIGLSLFLPMFMIEYDEDGAVGREEYYLDNYRYVDEMSGHEESHPYDSDNQPYKDMAKAGAWTRNLCLVTAVVLLALILSLVLSGLGKINPVITVVIFALALVLCLVVTIYTARSFSTPMLDFYELEGNPLFGSQDNYSWSPGLGWFFIVVSTIAVLACGIADAVLIWKERKRRAELSDY